MIDFLLHNNELSRYYLARLVQVLLRTTVDSLTVVQILDRVRPDIMKHQHKKLHPVPSSPDAFNRSLQ